MIGHFILRLVLWFLLTANLSLANLVIGVCIAFLLPFQLTASESLQEWLQMPWKVLKTVPQAYLEAVELIFRPHQAEKIVMERSRRGRSPGLIFLDIFLITFTPKTIVLKYHEEGWYEVHRVVRRSEKRCT